LNSHCSELNNNQIQQQQQQKFRNNLINIILYIANKKLKNVEIENLATAL
jgi:hypothetical protein